MTLCTRGAQSRSLRLTLLRCDSAVDRTGEAGRSLACAMGQGSSRRAKVAERSDTGRHR
jgi:hypothetical protein